MGAPILALADKVHQARAPAVLGMGAQEHHELHDCALVWCKKLSFGIFLTCTVALHYAPIVIASDIRFNLTIIRKSCAFTI